VSRVRGGRLQQTASVIKRHGFDIERAQDGFLVDQVCVVGARVACRQNDAHVAEVDIDRSQVGTVQRGPLHTPRTIARIPAEDWPR